MGMSCSLERKTANSILCVCHQHRHSHRRWGRDSLILHSFTYRANFPAGSPNRVTRTEKPPVKCTFHYLPYEGRSKFKVLYDIGNWPFPLTTLFHTLLSLKSSLIQVPCTLHCGPCLLLPRWAHSSLLHYLEDLPNTLKLFPPRGGVGSYVF